MQHINDRLKLGVIITAIIIPCMLISEKCASPKNNDSISEEKNRIAKKAINIYTETKTEALTKGILTNDEYSNSDSLWIQLLIRNPDSALQYASYLNALMVKGGLKKWPSLKKNRNTAFIDSQSVLAFGPYQFGMLYKDYEKLPYEKARYIQKIGEGEYFVSAKFDNNEQLYMVEIKSGQKSANYIDNDLKYLAINLSDVISKKYSEYEEFSMQYPTILLMNPGQIRFFQKWTIGKKVIKIGVGEISAGSEYYVYCEIYNDSLFNNYTSYLSTKSDTKKQVDASKF